MKNKLLLSLGSSLLVFAPVMTVVACGEDPKPSTTAPVSTQAELDSWLSSSTADKGIVISNLNSSKTISQLDTFVTTSAQDFSTNVAATLGLTSVAINNKPENVTLKYTFAKTTTSRAKQSYTLTVTATASTTPALTKDRVWTINSNDEIATAQDLLDRYVEAIILTAPTAGTKTINDLNAYVASSSEWLPIADQQAATNASTAIGLTAFTINSVVQGYTIKGKLVASDTQTPSAARTYVYTITVSSAGLESKSKSVTVKSSDNNPATLSDQDKVNADRAIIDNFNIAPENNKELMELMMLMFDEEGGMIEDFSAFDQAAATALGFGTLPTLPNNSTLTYMLEFDLSEFPDWVPGLTPNDPSIPLQLFKSKNLKNSMIPTEPVYLNFSLTIKATLNSATADSIKDIRSKDSFQETLVNSFINEFNDEFEGITEPIVMLPFGTTTVTSTLIKDYFFYEGEDFGDMFDQLGLIMDITDLNTTAKSFKMSLKHISMTTAKKTVEIYYDIHETAMSELEWEVARIEEMIDPTDPTTVEEGTVFTNGENITSGTQFDIISELFAFNKNKYNYSLEITGATATYAYVSISVSLKTGTDKATTNQPIDIHVGEVSEMFKLNRIKEEIELQNSMGISLPSGTTLTDGVVEDDVLLGFLFNLIFIYENKCNFAFTISDAATTPKLVIKLISKIDPTIYVETIEFDLTIDEEPAPELP